MLPTPPDRLPGADSSSWLDPPQSAWAVWNLDQIAPCAEVSAGDDRTRPLPVADPPVALGGLTLAKLNGTEDTVDGVLAETETDALVVLQDGVLVHEQYGHDNAATGRHAVLSITKSIVGCVVGVLADEGVLELGAPVARYVPDLSDSGYGTATLRDLLDMRSGVQFVENYTDPSSDINQLDRRLVDIGLRAYLQTLVQERPHGGPFRYRSSETDVLGWVCEAASGLPMATLMSSLVWQPMGAEHDAYVSCDVTGMAVHDGGLAATARDLARFGQLLLDGGTVPDIDDASAESERTVVPARWLRDAWGVDADIRSAFADSPSELVHRGGWYRNQFWFRPGAHGDVLLCLGIHGQLIYVCRRTRTVCVKLSHWPQPLDLNRSQNTLRACDTIAGTLATAGRGRGSVAGGGLRGVAAGQRRSGLSTHHDVRTRDESMSPTRVPTDERTLRMSFASPLNGIPEIRTFFRTNTEPVYFFGPTAFNLLGIDRWVRNFRYVVYYDSWDGHHPRVFTPKNKPYVEFESSEQINNYLLRDPEVQAYLKQRGGRPKIAMVFFDAETEQLCEELGYDLILPPDELRRRLDSKIVTTQLGNEAGAPSVPNVLGRAENWPELVTLAEDNGLGTDLVVQTPYGDSGKTTFFIASEADWDRDAGDMIGQELKVMKRIDNKAAAVEACITRHGTIVGPFMTDLTGYPELTPYKGGWCGNDLFPEALTPEQRATAINHVRALGDRLAKEGYKGFLEIDVLIDLATDEVYLGELNPRISGASSMTNVTAGAYADVPLFLFHLLEFMDVEYTVDVEEINDRWRELAAVDVWSQLIMKEPNADVELIDAAPRTGTWRLRDDGSFVFHAASYDWHDITTEDEAFFLRVYAKGDYKFKGADLGILVTKGRMQTSDGLTSKCRTFIDAIRSQYVTSPIPEPPAVMPIAYVK